ncbi:MAG: hypothetical protein JO115_19045 [Pseudonocardiales bacterium]|nr:hypothetical protein [Pseudonocardiales bacterium]
MDARYEATWLPIGHEVAGQDPTALAVEHVERQCSEAGARGVLMTSCRRDAATPSLKRFARQHVHVTRRSRSSAFLGGGPVLLDMPDAGLLADAHKLAHGRSLCVIESGAFRLHGWAAATRAVDLMTGERTAPPTNETLRLLDALVFAGNNGWADGPGKRDAQRLLGELAVAIPSLDADFVAGYVISKGVSGEGVKRLRTIWSE